jgi:hypothetical protein
MLTLLARTLLILIFVCTPAFAELYQLGDLVYDSTSDITWLTDANSIVTSGYAESIGKPRGYVKWKDAKEYADNFELDSNTDWRLPDATDAEEGYGAYGELGKLYYTDLGNSVNDSNINFGVDDVSFTGVQSYGYWTGTRDGTSRNYWTFNFSNGASTLVSRKAARAVWLVHDGDIIGLITWQGEPTTWQGESVTW